MTNLSTAIRFDPGAQRNTDLVDLSRDFARKDNAAFLAEVARRLAEKASQPLPGGLAFDAGGVGCIGLSGEYGFIGYVIRRAQELVRVDRSPSYWSHAFLVYSALSADPAINRSKRRSAWIWESTLEPASAFDGFVERNGVSARRVADYSRSRFDLFAGHSVPNIAVLAIALTAQERAAVLDRADDPDVDQLRYDVSGLLGTWYAYITNQADHPNPLSAGNAVYCSAYVQLAYDAAGVDLAPGAHQRNTSPEHIWQGVRRLKQAFRTTDERGNPIHRPLAGWYCVRDRACLIAPVDLDLPSTLRTLTSRAEASGR